MKIIVFFLLIICAFLFFLIHPAYTQGDFGIIVDSSRIDFGLMQAGEIKGDEPSQGINATCTTSWSNGWFLRIYLSAPFELQGGYVPRAIPEENFFWYGMNTTGLGTLVTNEQDFTQERVVYTAPAGEGADGVDIRIRFKLKIPEYQAKGRYQGTVTLVLIEHL